MKREGWETNRDIKRKPKRAKLWCLKCDMNIIGQGERCRVCGFKDMRRTNKKE